MRSFDGLRLLKGITLATALVVGASAQLPFSVQAQEVVATDGLFRESVLLELFSQPSTSEELKSLSVADLLQRGYVKDAKGGVYKVLSKKVSGDFGTHEVSTADLVKKNYYFDSIGGRSTLRKQVGSSPNSFDPAIYGLSVKMTEHVYYDFGGRVGAGGLNNDALAQIRAYVESRGGKLITDANGNIIGFDFGNANLKPNDDVLAALMAFFNGQRPNAPSTGGVVGVVTPGAPAASGATGDANLDALLAVLYGANGGNGASASGVIFTQPGANPSANNQGNLGIIGIPSNPNSVNLQPGMILIGSDGQRYQVGPDGKLILIDGGNGNQANAGPNGGFIFGTPSAPNSSDGNQGALLTIPQGPNSDSAGNYKFVYATGDLPSESNNPSGLLLGADGQKYKVGPDGRVILVGGADANAGNTPSLSGFAYGNTPSEQNQNAGSQLNVFSLPGNTPANSAGGAYAFTFNSQGQTAPYVYNGQNYTIISQLGNSLSRMGLTHSDLAYHFAYIHQTLGMDLVDSSKITNLSDIKDPKKYRSFKVGDYTYALTRVETKKGGLFGIGSESVWVFTQEVPGKGYRLVSAEEQAMLSHYVNGMLEHAKKSEDKEAISKWQKILDKMKDEGLESYNLANYDEVRKLALDPNSPESQLNAGQQMVYDLNRGFVFITTGTTAPGVQGQGANIFQIGNKDNLEALSLIFRQNAPNASAEDFSQWLFRVAQGQGSSGNPDLDAWVIANYNRPANTPSATAPKVDAPKASASVNASSERVAAYILTPLNQTNAAGERKFEITRFFKQGGREFGHETEYLFLSSDKVKQNADGTWVLVGEAAVANTGSANTAPSAAPNRPTSPEKQVDQNLKRLEQVISSVTADFIDENGNILQTTHARLEPGISVDAFRAFVESQGSKLIFDESKDFRN